MKPEPSLYSADRNIQTTFSRIWRNIGLSGRAKLMMSIFYSIFNKEEISEEELEKMKSQDMLNSVHGGVYERVSTFKDTIN